MTASLHNRVLRASERRALELEGRLARILEPILAEAGRQAASRFRATATDHLTASAAPALRRGDRLAHARRPIPGALRLTASAGDVQSNSTMVCVKPRPAEAAAIADPDGAPAENLHVTLAYLGEVDGSLDAVLEALRPVAASHAALAGIVAGYGMFAGEGAEWPAILLPDVPGLVELRVAATEALEQAGIGYGRDHGFAAHITLDYVEPGAGDGPFRPDQAGAALHFDELLLVRGDTEVYPLPLVGPPPLTAAGRPDWSPPAGDEVLDVASLVRKLRGRTDPVRRAVVETTMGKTLEKAGISFDATNPLTAKVLAQAGSQVTEIARTTQLNVMRIISASYEEGLTIPDTAAAIRAGMAEASTVRATLIARTELAGAVNGGSLAATQIVQAETGTRYLKRWMTASGAQFPRHENYEGLDGQTVGLDDYFDVGGAQMQHPGDPDGPVDEIANCRCAMSYVEDADA